MHIFVFVVLVPTVDKTCVINSHSEPSKLKKSIPRSGLSYPLFKRKSDNF